MKVWEDMGTGLLMVLRVERRAAVGLASGDIWPSPESGVRTISPSSLLIEDAVVWFESSSYIASLESLVLHFFARSAAAQGFFDALSLFSSSSSFAFNCSSSNLTLSGAFLGAMTKP